MKLHTSSGAGAGAIDLKIVSSGAGASSILGQLPSPGGNVKNANLTQQLKQRPQSLMLGRVTGWLF